MNNIKTKYDLLNEVYQDQYLPKMAKTIMQYLVYKSDDKECFPSNDTIAAAVNCCRRYVQMNMRKLEKAGYVIRKARYYDHCQLTNKYCFNISLGDTIKERTPICKEEKKIYNNFFHNLKPIKCKKIQLLKLIYSSDLCKTDKAVVVYFVNRANSAGCAYNRIDRVCKELNITNNVLREAIRRLRSRGLLNVKVDNGLIGIKLYIRPIKNLNRAIMPIAKANDTSDIEVNAAENTILEANIDTLKKGYKEDNVIKYKKDKRVDQDKEYYQNITIYSKIMCGIKSIIRPINRFISKIAMLL